MQDPRAALDAEQGRAVRSGEGALLRGRAHQHGGQRRAFRPRRLPHAGHRRVCRRVLRQEPGLPAQCQPLGLPGNRGPTAAVSPEQCRGEIPTPPPRSWILLLWVELTPSPGSERGHSGGGGGRRGGGSDGGAAEDGRSG